MQPLFFYTTWKQKTRSFLILGVYRKRPVVRNVLILDMTSQLSYIELYGVYKDRKT